MRVPEMFSDHGMFMFLYALMEMAASVSGNVKNLKKDILKIKISRETHQLSYQSPPAS